MDVSQYSPSVSSDQLYLCLRQGPLKYAMDTDDTLVLRSPSDPSGSEPKKCVNRKLFVDDGEDAQIPDASPSPSANPTRTGLVPMPSPSSTSDALEPHGPKTPEREQDRCARHLF